MGKVPVRLKEVVYTLSPFQQSVMNGLWYVRRLQSRRKPRNSLPRNSR